MKYIHRCLSVTLVLFLLTSLVYGQTYSIMPLGNSITQGDNNHFSYRYKLWTKLIDDGLDFDFVGSHSDHYNCGTPNFPNYNGQVFDTDHEGHWGWRCDQILNGGPGSGCAGSGNLPLWLNSTTPDIVLLHLGTNDLFQGQSVSSTITEIESIITLLRADNPNVSILLSTVIPTLLFPLQNKIIQLNELIPGIAVALADPSSPIIIVDQFSGFDPNTDTQADGVHPNELGEEKMAQKWRDGIQLIAGSPTGLHLNLKVILGGAYLNAGMQGVNPFLTTGQQPFNQTPWNYPGAEQLNLINANAVDWVLVELRDADSASVAHESTVVARQACVLYENGQVVNVDESPDLFFDVSVSKHLFVVIHHLNHLPIMSRIALSENTGIYSYDFTSIPGQSFGGLPAMLDFNDGFFGMIPGDFNNDGIINETDKSQGWNNYVGISGYQNSDMNRDGQINNQDKNAHYIPNYGEISYVP